MATSKIPTLGLKTGTVSTNLTVPGNGSSYTNLKTLIDGNRPSGCKCLGVVGFTTAEQNIVPVSIRYENTNYSLQVKNVSTSARTGAITVYYLYI